MQLFSLTSPVESCDHWVTWPLCPLYTIAQTAVEVTQSAWNLIESWHAGNNLAVRPYEMLVYSRLKGPV